MGSIYINIYICEQLIVVLQPKKTNCGSHFTLTIYITFSVPEQDEQDGLRGNSNGEELLTWQDYKAMPFTQCVCIYIDTSSIACIYFTLHQLHLT